MSVSPPRSQDAVDSALQYLARMGSMFDPVRIRAWAELGLTTAQLRVMFLTRQQPGVPAGELASRLGVTPPTISGIVDRLVKLQLVRREDDEYDRRLVRNHLTPAGEKACGWLERGMERYTRRILLELDDGELDTFVAAMRAFVEASERVARAEPDLAAIAMPGMHE